MHTRQLCKQHRSMAVPEFRSHAFFLCNTYIFLCVDTYIVGVQALTCCCVVCEYGLLTVLSAVLLARSVILACLLFK